MTKSIHLYLHIHATRYMRRVSYRYIERDACLQLILNNAIKLKMTKSIHLYLHIHATPLLTIVSRGQAFHVSPQDFLLVLDAGFLAIVLFWAAVFFAPPLLAGFFAILPAGLPAGFFMITFSRGFMRLRSVTLLFHISLVKSEYGAKRSSASGFCMDIE